MTTTTTRRLTGWELTEGGLHATFETRYGGLRLTGETRALGWEPTGETGEYLKLLGAIGHREEAGRELRETAEEAFELAREEQERTGRRYG